MANVQALAQQDSNVVTALSQDKPVGVLQEDNGNYSAMRLMSFIALISAIFFGSYTLIKPEVKDTGTNLTFIFLTAAFAPKAVQKFAEAKKPAE